MSLFVPGTFKRQRNTILAPPEISADALTVDEMDSNLVASDTVRLLA